MMINLDFVLNHNLTNSGLTNKRIGKAILNYLDIKVFQQQSDLNSITNVQMSEKEWTLNNKHLP